MKIKTTIKETTTIDREIEMDIELPVYLKSSEGYKYKIILDNGKHSTTFPLLVVFIDRIWTVPSINTTRWNKEELVKNYLKNEKITEENFNNDLQNAIAEIVAITKQEIAA